MFKKLKNTAIAALALSAITVSGQAKAAEILFGLVGYTGYTSHPYHGDGLTIAQMLTNAGHTVTTVDLWDQTLGAADFVGVDQVWVYDLATGANADPTSNLNYASIANWFDSTTHDLILDGRMISSAWKGIGTNEEAWIQSYASELQQRNGGLVLGTDHSAFQAGINSINALINVDPFQLDFGTSHATVDQTSPLYSAAGTYDCPGNPGERCIYDQSSPGLVATGVQADPAIELTPVAYHGTISSTNFSNAYNLAAVSATFGSTQFGTCGNPGQPACDPPEAPAPAPLALIGLGLVALAARRYRFKR